MRRVLEQMLHKFAHLSRSWVFSSLQLANLTLIILAVLVKANTLDKGVELVGGGLGRKMKVIDLMKIEGDV